MFINPPPDKPSTSRGRRPAGFSLMEVVIALTILGMIMGTLFAIIQGSVRAAAQIEQLQRENDAINRFLDLSRKAFTTLPSTATLTLTALDPNNPLSSGQELTISGSTHCFSFGLSPISYEDTILGLRPDPNGATDANGLLLQYLSLSREDLIPQTDDSGMALRQETTGLSAPDEQGRYWMPLLPDVVQLKWRFYKEDDETWLEEWDDSDWPDLIEIQLQMRDRSTPMRMVYSVPTIHIIAGTGGSTSSSSGSSSGSSSQGGQTGGNQGGGRGDQGGGGRPGGGGQNGGSGRPGGGGQTGGGGPGGGQGGGGGRPGGGPGGGQSSGGGSTGGGGSR
ncbi:prepilin-type N-terminal cleavage/methylation domain-containing protein [Prosthecobacter sp. SYSU 5D2]|uniref:prepilin-type N-terminal cleavage/methylation domain-containing protein n=1 Tax=Prosthecobacter sp. SYSU 5D2 TaxID=3134134 RepID=UPI0031FEFAE1